MARRIRVSLSAPAATGRLWAASSASRNRSTGDVAGPSGTGGSVIGWKAQCCLRSSHGSAAASGNGAPIAAQRLKSAICRSVSFSLGGIDATPSAWRTLRRNKPLSGLSGSNNSLPLPPPRASPAAVSNRKSDRCLSGPWQRVQCAANSGRTLVSKNFVPAAVGSPARRDTVDVSTHNPAIAGNRDRTMRIRTPRERMPGGRDFYYCVSVSPGKVPNVEPAQELRVAPRKTNESCVRAAMLSTWPHGR